MAIVGSVTLTSSFRQIVPPDDAEHPGTFSWAIVLPASAIVADDASGDNTTTLPASQTLLQLVGANEALFAKGSGTVNVIGFAHQ